MTNKNLRRNDGFTIIEVLIVLAIAGLIMLIVFLAVPALQRNARNTSRKNDAGTLASAISEYVNNNDGQVPASCTGGGCAFASNWKPGLYQATKTGLIYTNYTAPNKTLGDPKDVNVIEAASYMGCNGTAASGNPKYGATPRSIAIVYDVEVGGGGAPQEQCLTAN